jgi:hypothetical protein
MRDCCDLFAIAAQPVSFSVAIATLDQIKANVGEWRMVRWAMRSGPAFA